MFKRVLECENTDTDVSRLVPWQNEYYCRLDFLWRDKFKRECEEIETMENLNRVLLENVLPAHVAEHFLGCNWKNEVSQSSLSGKWKLIKLRRRTDTMHLE